MIGRIGAVESVLTCTSISQPWTDENRQSCLMHWRGVFERATSASPFLSPEWVEAWLLTYGRTLAPELLLLRSDEDAVVGACLMTPSTRRILGMPRSRLHLNTDGEPSGASVIVEHNAVLALPGWEQAVTTAVAQWAARKGCQEIIASGVDAPTLEWLTDSLEGWRCEVEWRDAPFVDLARIRDAQTSHLQLLSANTRSQIRRALKAYSDLGEFGVEAATTRQRAEELFAELTVLHAARWQARGQSGAFASALRNTFHRHFIELGATAGAVQLLRVFAGAKTIGILYNLHANGRVAFYQSGFDYADDGRRHPGLITHHLAIEYLCQRGYVEYDFLVSGAGEGRYKRSLATDVRALAWAEFSRPSLQSFGLHSLRIASRALRQRFASLRKRD